jgi:CheY-like chemotaxis protein
MAGHWNPAQIVTDVAADAEVVTTGVTGLPDTVAGDSTAFRQALSATIDGIRRSGAVGTPAVHTSPIEGSRHQWRVTVSAEAGPEGIGPLRAGFDITLTPAPAAPDTAPLSVLVVDDSSQQRALVAAYLSGMPHVIVEAAGGASAVELCTGRRFDVILMDIQMPGVNGISATRAIRKLEDDKGRAPSVIVALTSLGASDDVEEADLAGADECLAKPLTRTALLKALSVAPRVSPPATPNTPVEPVEPVEPVGPDYTLTADQLVALTRYQITGILRGLPGTQIERFRLLGRSLGATAAQAGLADVAQLARRMEDAAASGSEKNTTIAARVLLAWLVRVGVN